MTGKAVATPVDLLEAGHAFLDLGARAVLVKGGHSDGDECIDVLFQRDSLNRRISFLVAYALAMTTAQAAPWRLLLPPV